ncbi:MAG TPA: UDP-N-acetylglucosamine 2-epimerase [Sedimentibacter sp.]|nr:UDP-N-acetylglucosamine 2-epimerase [Sedimentibacter sp.]
MLKTIFFFIGTDAEFIKLFPIIDECKQNKVSIKIIASGQNDITKSRILSAIHYGPLDLELSQEDSIKKNAIGLFNWFAKTKRNAVKKIKNAFPETDFSNSIMVVHGDTVSTLMGASVGQKLGMTVCHVEAGLRSHNLLNPFPEEIDRMLTSRKCRLHFAPGSQPCENLSKAKGKVINTKFNTILDSLHFSMKIQEQNPIIKELKQQEYFVFVIHRQENLMNKKFVIESVEEILKVACNMKCVIILHIPTKVTFENLGILSKLEKDKNIVLVPRMDYFDFMKLLDYSQFVITDGGSNQEELHYMGKPCLIMRKTTERNQGIGQNAVMYEGDVKNISRFYENYKDKKLAKTFAENSPSHIIYQELVREINKHREK